MKARRIGIGLALAGALALLALPAGAEGEIEGWGYQLANELMSPYCPGRALAECPSPQAEELREWILAREREGRSREEVEAELYEEFGDGLRQAPRPSGIGLVAYAIPLLVVLAGGGLVWHFLRRQGRIAPASEAPAPRLAPVDAELERQLEAELQESSSETW